MNVVEGLSREIHRVATIQQRYLELPDNAGAIAAEMMAQHLEASHVAMGNGDPLEMMRMIQALRDFEE